MELGLSVWELFINEHGIQPDGVKPIVYNEDFYDNYIFKSFFNETIDNRFIPRCLFIDTEPNLINTIEKVLFQSYFFEKISFLDWKNLQNYILVDILQKEKKLLILL